MKTTGFLFLFSALFFSCSNELDIAADYKETTIIYGLLNQADSVQYIQVFKGFLDENTSALVIAQNPDSVYYNDSVEVKLEGGSQTFLLEKILGPRRDTGIFVDSPNYVYKFSGILNPNTTYKLTVNNKQTGHVVTAQTPVVKDFVIVRPSEFFPVNFATKSLNEVQWRAAENGKVYELIMRFFYEEWNISNPGDIDTLYIDWVVFNEYTSNELQYKFDGTEFLKYLGRELTVDEYINRRALPEPLQFRFYVGANELYEYIRVNGAQTGITSLQVKPTYTNVTNGLGIFSSRYFKPKSGIKMTSLSDDSLSCGQYTKQLNFVNEACN